MRSFAITDVLHYLQESNQIVDFVGDEETVIQHIANIRDLEDRSISWIKNESFFTEAIKESIELHKDLLIVSSFPVDKANTIITENPKRTFFSILNHFAVQKKPTGIHPTATVETEQVGKRVFIGANCYIGPDVVIGDDVIIHHNVVIENPCIIGDHTEIFSGVVIGSEGYGYYKDGDVPVHEQHYMGVRIGQHVDIGANTCIDRGLIGDTVIGNHVKIDDLCMIGHNVQIDDNSMVIAGTILCGSAVLEKNVYMAPGSIVMNQATVHHDSVVGLGTVVLRNVKPNKVMFGVPACVVDEVKK